MYIIYKAYFKNNLNNKVYIGLTNNFNRRKTQHINNAKKKHKTTAFYNAINKYKKENLIFEVLENNIKIKQEALKKEIRYIKKYNSYKNGYNMTPGGEFIVKNQKYSDEDLINICRRFETKSALRKTFSSIRRLAKGRGIWEECSKHFKKHKILPTKWTKNNILATAKKYNTYGDFIKREQSAYVTAHRKKWINDIRKIFNKRKLTKEIVIKEAKKYKTKTQWFRNYQYSYEFAKKHNFFIEATKHMNKKK